MKEVKKRVAIDEGNSNGDRNKTRVRWWGWYVMGMVGAMVPKVVMGNEEGFDNIQINAHLVKEIKDGLATNDQFVGLGQSEKEEKLREWFEEVFRAEGVYGELKRGNVVRDWEVLSEAWGGEDGKLKDWYDTWLREKKAVREELLTGGTETYDKFFAENEMKIEEGISGTASLSKDETAEYWTTLAREKGLVGGGVILAGIYAIWRRRKNKVEIRSTEVGGENNLELFKNTLKNARTKSWSEFYRGVYSAVYREGKEIGFSAAYNKYKNWRSYGYRYFKKGKDAVLDLIKYEESVKSLKSTVNKHIGVEKLEREEKVKGEMIKLLSEVSLEELDDLIAGKTEGTSDEVKEYIEVIDMQTPVSELFPRESYEEVEQTEVNNFWELNNKDVKVSEELEKLKNSEVVLKRQITSYTSGYYGQAVRGYLYYEKQVGVLNRKYVKALSDWRKLSLEITNKRNNGEVVTSNDNYGLRYYQRNMTYALRDLNRAKSYVNYYKTNRYYSGRINGYLSARNSLNSLPSRVKKLENSLKEAKEESAEVADYLFGSEKIVSSFEKLEMIREEEKKKTQTAIELLHRKYNETVGRLNYNYRSYRYWSYRQSRTNQLRNNLLAEVASVRKLAKVKDDKLKNLENKYRAVYTEEKQARVERESNRQQQIEELERKRREIPIKRRVLGYLRDLRSAGAQSEYFENVEKKLRNNIRYEAKRRELKTILEEKTETEKRITEIKLELRKKNGYTKEEFFRKFTTKSTSLNYYVRRAKERSNWSEYLGWLNRQRNIGRSSNYYGNRLSREIQGIYKYGYNYTEGTANNLRYLAEKAKKEREKSYKNWHLYYKENPNDFRVKQEKLGSELKVLEAQAQKRRDAITEEIAMIETQKQANLAKIEESLRWLEKTEEERAEANLTTKIVEAEFDERVLEGAKNAELYLGNLKEKRKTANEVVAQISAKKLAEINLKSVSQSVSAMYSVEKHIRRLRYNSSESGKNYYNKIAENRADQQVSGSNVSRIEDNKLGESQKRSANLAEKSLSPTNTFSNLKGANSDNTVEAEKVDFVAKFKGLSSENPSSIEAAKLAVERFLKTRNEVENVTSLTSLNLKGENLEVAKNSASKLQNLIKATKDKLVEKLRERFLGLKGAVESKGDKLRKIAAEVAEKKRLEEKRKKQELANAEKLRSMETRKGASVPDISAHFATRLVKSGSEMKKIQVGDIILGKATLPNLESKIVISVSFPNISFKNFYTLLPRDIFNCLVPHSDGWDFC